MIIIILFARTHSEALREKRLARVKREQAYLDAKLEEEATRAALLTTLIHPTKKKIDSRVALQAAHLDQVSLCILFFIFHDLV